jgi:hypothetical protein
MDFLGIIRRTAEAAFEGQARANAPRHELAECTPCAANKYVQANAAAIRKQFGTPPPKKTKRGR